MEQSIFIYYVNSSCLKYLFRIAVMENAQEGEN